MSAKLHREEPADPTRINLHEEWELAYWVKLLDISEADLRDAVRAVGPDSEAVRRHLGKRHTQR